MSSSEGPPGGADGPVGDVRWSGPRGPLTTRRVDLLAALFGGIVATLVGVLTPLSPAFAALVGGPVAGLLNRIYDAELAAGFLAGVLGTVLLVAVGLALPLVDGTPAALAGTLLISPFLGLVAGVLAIPCGRVRERFSAGRRSAR
jgi:hypothetical protein